jgi:hypothetical protein
MRRLLKSSALFAGIVVAALVLSTASAAADTIHLEVSPTSPPLDGPMTVTATGEVSSAGQTLRVLQPEGLGPCPEDFLPGPPLGYLAFNTGGEPEATFPLYSDAFTQNFASNRFVCAYLTTEPGRTTVARAELVVTYGPTKEETEQTQRNKEIEERNAASKKAGEEAHAAEVKRGEEATAKRKYEEEAPAREAAAKKAKEAAEQAAINAEDARVRAEYEAAKSRAHKRPVTHLSVKTVAQRGNSSQNPGQTGLEVMATSFAHVTIKLTRYGHSAYHLDAAPNAADAYDMPTPGQNTTPEPIPALSWAGIAITWTCSRPGGTYRYVVTARSDVGRTLTRRGSFSPVSVAHCHELKRHEQEARERSARKYAKEVSQRAREERERLERYEYNCRAEGGTPVTLHTSEGNVRECRAPGGGLLPVPE